MNSPHPARVREIFDAAMDLPASQRLAFVGNKCRGDEHLIAEVLALMAALEKGGDALDTGAAACLGLTTGTTAHGDDVGISPGDFTASAVAGVSIGGFRLLRLLGSGGMGTVYEATQVHPSRTVALKVMRPSAGAGGAHRRFVEESQILARLHHPGIAQVYAAGTHTIKRETSEESMLAQVLGIGRDVPWIAMEFVEGARPISVYATEEAITVRRRLELVAEAADAVHHGHMKGIIHRDLKPANLLVDASGRLKVIDFGVARALGASTTAASPEATSAGVLLGTLRYMSPEQCDGDPHALDTRSDVYSLGIVLYELLTGEPPCVPSGHSLTATVRAIRDATPLAPSHFAPPLRGDIDRIVLKAIEKDRDRRYQSAADFADDIRRHLGNFPIRARPSGVAHRAVKFTRRNPVLVSVGALAAIACIAGAVGVSVSLARAVRAEASERARRDEAERRAYVADLFAAGASINAHDGGGAIARLDAAPESRRGWEWQYLRALADQSTSCHESPTGEARFCISPDGRVVVGHSASGLLRAIDPDMRHIQWSLATLPPEGEPRFSADGRMIVVSGEGRAILVDAADGRSVREFTLPANVYGLGSSISPDLSLLAVGCNWGSGLRVFDARSGKQVFASATQAWVYSTDFSPDGRFLACSEFPDTVVRETHSWAEVLRFPTGRASQYEPSDLRYSPDGQTIAITTGLNIELYNAATGSRLRTLQGHTQRVQTIAFDRSGSRVATGSIDKTVRVWDASGASEPVVLLGHGAAVDSVAFVPGTTASAEKLLWSGAAESGVRTWQPRPQSSVAGFRFSASASYVHQLTFDKRSRVLLALCGNQVGEWDAQAGKAIGPLRTHTLYFPSGNPNSRLLAGPFHEAELQMLDLDTHTRTWRSPLPASRHALSCVSPDGLLVATGLASGGIRIVNASDGSLVHDIGVSGEETTCLQFAPDASTLLTGSQDGSTRVWSTGSWSETTHFNMPGHAMHGLSVQSGGHLAASGGSDECVHLWNIHTGQETRTITGLRSTVWCIAFSPDGRRLAVGSQDRLARIFDVASGDELLQLRRHTGTVMTLAWSPDGRFLATGGFDEWVYVWDSKPNPSENPSP